MESTHNSCQIVKNLELSRRIFLKIVRLHENPSRTEMFCVDGEADRHTDRQTDGRTTRHDKANGHFSHVGERASYND